MYLEIICVKSKLMLCITEHDILYQCLRQYFLENDKEIKSKWNTSITNQFTGFFYFWFR